MKKLILPLLLLVACSNTSDKDYNNVYITPLGRYHISEVKVDYCEYIIVKSYDGITMVHKANCANDFH